MSLVTKIPKEFLMAKVKITEPTIVDGKHADRGEIIDVSLTTARQLFTATKAIPAPEEIKPPETKTPPKTTTRGKTKKNRKR